jgi:hypothetical protein
MMRAGAGCCRRRWLPLYAPGDEGCRGALPCVVLVHGARVVCPAHGRRFAARRLPDNLDAFTTADLAWFF